LDGANAFGLFASPATFSSPFFHQQQQQKRKQINRRFKNPKPDENYSAMLKKILLNSNQVTFVSTAPNQDGSPRKTSKTTTILRNAEKPIPKIENLVENFRPSHTFITTTDTEINADYSLYNDTTYYKYDFNKPLIDYNSSLNLFRRQDWYNYSDYKNTNRQNDFKNR
jgi:hypothetical protein